MISIFKKKRISIFQNRSYEEEKGGGKEMNGESSPYKEGDSTSRTGRRSQLELVTGIREQEMGSPLEFLANIHLQQLRASGRFVQYGEGFDGSSKF
ncbi:hypothetical protein KFK09_013347 [Dendrobium nobile]|uniref:Uncharacterized protein n=1 Tax=Dendrobium nobile TaxID=94219 RepID=A0A8T3B8K3_DENNO|nr:hypothetical protein KFK09_013347 [Dendrobium nobile]